MPHSKVCVAIVTCNSERYIRRCLEAVLQQDGVSLETVVVDNASTDGTAEILREFGARIRTIWNQRNAGFSQAQNQAVRSSASDWVLTLNPDALLLPGFIRTLVDAGEAHPGAGTVCGKLLSIGTGFQPLAERRIDSTGIFFTPAMRHFDRGWHQPDIPYFENMEYVFGASAAAALYRRTMIDDVAVDGHFFDPDFFAYREDADVAWRALLLGWSCIYTPAAVAYHVRTMVPGKRRSVPAVINMHSVKNRFLMRVKNATGGLYRRYWLPMTVRDLMVAAGAVLAEPTSLPAFWHIARCLPRALRQRRAIMSRRRLSDAEMASWFNYIPAARPVHPVLDRDSSAWAARRAAPNQATVPLA
ncbi:MAG: glycosyltransferase family 2 protein [Acidobacteriia bacterium]|nr:glycosyltransferase family 2 protein [Terriglobia bacterium]